MAIATRRLKEVVNYARVNIDRRDKNIAEARYKTINCRWLTLDRIRTHHFFADVNWDPVKKRQLHKYVKINMVKLLPTAWEDKGLYRGKQERRRCRQALCIALINMMIRDMIHDMMYKGNRLIFPCMWKGQVFGWYKIGYFTEYRPYSFKERLILAIVPHEREVIDNWYPVISCHNKTWGYTERHTPKTKVIHEDINVQERLAAHNRSNGLGRRVSSPAKTKTHNL